MLEDLLKAAVEGAAATGALMWGIGIVVGIGIAVVAGLVVYALT